MAYLINVGSRGFGWRFALRRGPVCGLSPDGACWPAGLHRSISTTKVLKGYEKVFFSISFSMSDEHLHEHTMSCQFWKTFGYFKSHMYVCVSLLFLMV